MSDKLNLAEELARYAKGQGKLDPQYLINAVQHIDTYDRVLADQVRGVLKKNIPIHIRMR